MTKFSRAFAYLALFSATICSVAASDSQIVRSSPTATSVIQGTKLEALPTIGRDASTFVVMVPGVDMGAPKLSPDSTPNEIPPELLDNVAVVGSGWALDTESRPVEAFFRQERNIGGIINVVTKPGSQGPTEGDVFWFDVDENGVDEDDPRVRYYFDGFYLEGLSKLIPVSSKLYFFLTGDFETTDPHIQTNVTGYQSNYLPIHRVTHRQGASFPSYLPRGNLEGFEVHSSVGFINPDGDVINFDIRAYDPTGAQEEVIYGGETGNSFSMSVDPFSTETASLTANSGDFKTSALEIVSPEFGLPLYAALPSIKLNVDYRTWELGGDTKVLRGSAGLAPALPGLVHTLPLLKTEEGFDTAFSLQNVTDEVASIYLYLYDDESNEAEEKTPVKRAELSIAPHAFETGFGLEYFNEQTRGHFSGSALVVSDRSLAVTPLTTFQGFQVSSQPGGVFDGD